MAQFRRCPRCGEEKPNDAFTSTYCRPCFAAYARKRRGSPDLTVKPCGFCTIPFAQKRTDSRYCSRTCADAAKYRKAIQSPSERRRRAAYNKQRYNDNREFYLAAGAKWRAENRAAFRETQRRWALLNTERIRAGRSAYRLANLAKFAEKEARRRDRIAIALVIVPTAEQMESKLAYWGHRCWMCGDPADTIDHVKPLRVSGPHILANMRPACRSCNSSKNSKWFGPQTLSMFIRQ